MGKSRPLIFSLTGGKLKKGGRIVNTGSDLLIFIDIIGSTLRGLCINRMESKWQSLTYLRAKIK